MQISPIKNQNFEKPSRNLSNRTKVKILKKKFLGISQKNLVPRMLCHRGNVWTSKFWRKSKEKKRNFISKIYEGHIRIWLRSKKNSKLSHACVPLSSSSGCTQKDGKERQQTTFWRGGREWARNRSIRPQESLVLYKSCKTLCAFLKWSAMFFFSICSSRWSWWRWVWSSL